MILTHEFYKNHDSELIVKELRDKVEFSVIKNVAKVCEGNVVSCVKILDWIWFNNNSSLCTLLAILGTNSLIPESFTNENDFNVIRQRMQRDTERVVEQILRFATDKFDIIE